MAAGQELQANDEFEKLAAEMATGGGERTEVFNALPTLSVYNKTEGGAESPFQAGDFSKSTKTENGYKNEAFDKPFNGIILKTRMMLRTKMQAKNDGVPNYISDEFDSYAPGEVITVKEKTDEGYVIVFQGNYKEVQEHFSEKNKFGKTNKYLDLQYHLYVLPDLSEPTSLVKIIVKGMSRGEFFDFMKLFTRRAGDFMGASWTVFDSKEHTTNFKGDPLKFPVFSFSFEKGERLTIEELREAVTMQKKLNEALEMQRASFQKKDEVNTDAALLDSGSAQPPAEEEIPIINLDLEDNPLEETPATEELPKDKQGNDVPFK